MGDLLRLPLLVWVLSFVTLWLAARVGLIWRSKRGPLEEDSREDHALVVGAILTLLGLIIGFTFSMAVSRYDQRKAYEEEEANAIGTEYVRADLLPAAEAERVRGLLRSYLDQRVLFYTTRNRGRLAEVDAETARLQRELWSTVQKVAVQAPTPVTALAVSGMNDVLNSQGYTQASWWNQIPPAAWALMAAIAVACNLLVGYGVRSTRRRAMLLLPLVVSLAFFLIADIDSPRAGVIRVIPQNLISLAGSLQAP